jgi:hypothetical protein
MRYRLRTLLIVLAVGPPLGAWGWSEYAKYCERKEELEALKKLKPPRATADDRVIEFGPGDIE